MTPSPRAALEPWPSSLCRLVLPACSHHLLWAHPALKTLSSILLTSCSPSRVPGQGWQGWCVAGCHCNAVGRGLLEPSAWQCASGRGLLSSGAPSDVCLLSGAASVLRGAGPGPRAPLPPCPLPTVAFLAVLRACYRASLSRAALCPHANVFPRRVRGSCSQGSRGGQGSGTTQVNHFSCFSQCPMGTGTTPWCLLDGQVVG